MSYDDYESVNNLDTADQLSLLHQGDAVERVWTAWSIALRLGPRAIPELRDCLESSPSPGTRRHLIVVLAGLGERSIPESCATQDPDEFVRSTGARYLIRTSVSPIKLDLLDQLLDDPSPIVRTTVVQEIGKSWDHLPSNRIEKLINDPDPEVRHVAIEKSKDRQVNQKAEPSRL